MMQLRTILLLGLLFFAGAPAKLSAHEVVQTLFHTTFDEEEAILDWRAERDCRIVVRDQFLRVEALQGQPQISRFTHFIGGTFRLIVELRTGTESQATLHWTSQGSPRRDEIQKETLALQEDGHWNTYDFVFTVPDILTSLMIRFTAPDGTWDIRSIRLTRKRQPPLSIRDTVPIVHQDDAGHEQKMMQFTVANDVLVPMRYRIGYQTIDRVLLRDETINLGIPIRPEGNLAAAVLRLRTQDFPDIVHPVFLYYPEGHTDWIQKPFGDGMLIEIAPDARMARLWHLEPGTLSPESASEPFGIIAPIVHRGGVIPRFVLSDNSTETELHFEHESVDLRINIAFPFLNFEMTGKSAPDGAAALEGPVVRLFGKYRGGLLPGVEFIGAGGTSASEIDIESRFCIRTQPNPLWITMPLAVHETDKGAAALYWDDLSLQPIFSSPNRFDRTEDHRVSLIRNSPTSEPETLSLNLNASLELFPPALPGELSASHRFLRSYIARKGFPLPPPALRTSEEQRQLSMLALTNALQSELGGQWGYAFEPDWERRPFADMFSTLARLTEAGGGRIRNPTVLVPGGSDITNDSIFFLFDRIPEWQRNREESIRQIMAAVNADGSFLFRTRFPEWETAAGAFGHTALRTLEIMEYVRATGNNELFAIVTKALEYLEECDIPGGGFYRDTPFHTPDLQAAAALVWLYVWAYEYTGNSHYLDRAKHFAFAGLPFVYQTEQREHMLYGTVGKFGGTNRRQPLHFGLLSTSVGIQYAYALNLLSTHDEETDWKRVALGILIAVENLQYTEGSEAGCIPEFFDVVNQERRGWRVNPCALVSLRWVIEDKVDSLFVLVDGKERYVAPYPLRSTPEGVEAYNVPPGQRFHLMHNANRYGTGDGNGLVNVD